MVPSLPAFCGAITYRHRHHKINVLQAAKCLVQTLVSCSLLSSTRITEAENCLPTVTVLSNFSLI